MKKLVLLLVVVFAMVALVACGNTQNEKTNNNVVENEVQENEKTNVVEENVATSEEENENKISQLFEDYIKGLSEEEGKELAEYKIVDVSILSDEAKAEVIENFSGEYFETDVLASVNFSVRPEDPTSMAWQAGNGEQSGDWIVNKILLVTLRDGKLTGFGTSW